MYQEKYFAVHEKLKPYQAELIRKLTNLEYNHCSLKINGSHTFTLTYSLVDAYYKFLHTSQYNLPQQLGMILTKFGTTPAYITHINKEMRDFCITHLTEDLLVAGLEATADFFCHINESYVQTNQAMVSLASIKVQETERIKSSLTEQEITLLRNLAQGKTNAQIALTMNVTERTVNNYLKKIRTKLGTCNRADTIVAAVRLFPEI